MIKRIALLLAMLSPMAAHAEPITAAIAAFAAWAGVGVATVYLVAATVILSTGMAVYGSAQARRAERDARDARNAAMQDRMATRIASESPQRLVYGRAKVGGDIVAMFTSGDKDQYKHIVCVLAAHECDAVEEIYVNNVAVGLLNASGDATTGRFAPIPGTEVFQEWKTGPAFTLSKMPVGPVQAFALNGFHTTEVTVTGQSGRDITVAHSGTVIINYQYNVGRRFGEEVDETVAVATSSYVRAQIHLGTPTDPADAYLMSVVPAKWPATAVLRGLCYLVVTLDLNNPEFQGGQVPIQALVRGRKLLDVRTGLTAWSQNPALAVYDYLTSPLCGVAAADLPVAQYITAANVCDESQGGFVPFKRYTINGTVTSAENQASVLESMAQCMAGGIVSTTWDICAGKYIAPVLALDQSDIVGAISITPGVSDAAIYNGVKGQFISPENSYVMTDFAPFQNPAYLAADGRDLYTDIPFPFTDSLQRVHNLARIFTEDMRNGFTMKAEFSLNAWPLKVGQRITFTSAFLGQTAKVYRITDKSFAPNSAVELTLKEDDPSIWDFADAVTVDSTPNTDLPDPWAIAPLASLSCTSGVPTLLRQADGSIVPRILVTWPAATTASVFTNGEIEIEWRAISTDTWQKAKISGHDTEAYLSPITPGFFYVVRARTVNPYLNAKSDWIMVTYQVAVFRANAAVYKWSATKPATPSGAGVYTWATGAVTSPPSGWATTAPAAPGGDTTLWAATAPVSDITTSGTTAVDWSASDVAAIGYAPNATGAGPAGYSNARVYAYQRAASAPTGSPGAVDVDLTTGLITTATLTNGWQKTIPAANGNPLYVTAASASAAGTTDTIASGEWSGAVVLAQDGTTGAPGLNSATITIYQRSATATAPALPSASTTYTFATGVLTGLNNGWSQYAPTGTTGTYLFSSLATAAATTATDTIPSSEWAAAQVMMEAIIIGGRNLYSQTTSLNTFGDGASVPARSTTGFTLRGIVANNAVIRSYNIIPANGIFTISFDLRLEFANGYPLTLDFCDANGWTINPTTINQHFSFTFTVSNWTLATYNFIDFNGLSAQNYYFTNFKLEAGNKETAWTPSPEDVTADAQAKADAAVSTAAVAAQAKADLAETTAKAYADGIVTDEEARAILDATNKANAAEAAAKAAAAADASAKANLARGSNLFTGSLAAPFALTGASITDAAYIDPYGTTNAIVVSIPSNGAYAHYHFTGLATGFYTVKLKVRITNAHSPVVSTTNGATWESGQWARGATSSTSPVWVQVTLRQYTDTGLMDVLFGSFNGSSPQYTTPSPTAIAIADLHYARDGYAGDLDATKGAPTGTNVAGVPAETVVGNAASGASTAAVVNNVPVIAGVNPINYTMVYSAGSSKPIITITNSTSGGSGPYKYTYVLQYADWDQINISLTRSSTGGNTDNVCAIRGLAFNSGDESNGTITITATDSLGRSSSTILTFTVYSS